MPNPNISELLTTTIENRSGELRDNVTRNNALALRLKQKGKIKTLDGGVTIRHELSYAENGTYKRYSGYETLDVTPMDVLTSAEFDWKQAAIAVTISGREQKINGGSKTQILNLLESRLEVAEATFMNKFSGDIYSNGTADGGKQVGGLQLLVADSPATGTVGGINRATWPFWRNFAYSSISDGGGAATAANIVGYMDRVWVGTTRGNDNVDLIVADNNYFVLYLQACQNLRQFVDSKLADAGYQSIKFMGADVVLDGGYSGSAPTNRMYFLNTKYIHFCAMKGCFMDPLEYGEGSPHNQDALVKLIGLMGNLTLGCGFVQGVLRA